MSESDCFERIQAQIADGQYFLAFDSYREAASVFPDSVRLTLLGALALLRSGAVAEARRLLTPLGNRLESNGLRSRRITTAFRDAVRTASATRKVDTTAIDEAVARFVAALGEQNTLATDPETDTPETLGLVSRIHFEIWARLGDITDLERALLIAEQCYAGTQGLEDGLHTATLATLFGDHARATELAQSLFTRWLDIPETIESGTAARFRHHAIGAELALLLERHDEAASALSVAAALRPRHLPSVVEALRRLALFARAGIALPDRLRDCLEPPVVTLFAGQALDAPNCAEPCFPASLEKRVAERIAESLEVLGAEIGFSSASAGAELLFVEAMLDRGAEVHLFLPFGLEDFIRYRVAYAGGNWERRFRNALKLVTSISYATEEPFLGHTALLRFNNHLIHGMARAYSALNLSDPYLLVLWDYAAASDAGSAADFIDNWPDIGHLRLIDLDDLREQDAAAPALLPPTPAPPPTLDQPTPTTPMATTPERGIRTMLFADIVGYSQLSEHDLPLLWQCMSEVRPQLEATSRHLELIESWGDAIYAVMNNSSDMAGYAFALIDAIARMDSSGAGLSRPLQVRIGLHAGPVFEGEHPLTGRPIVYGTHVSRAARIEPVSLPGHVYASQQFVAMLLAEESARRHEAQMTGGQFEERYACEYLGMLSLAKNYGRQQVYHIRRTGSLED